MRSPLSTISRPWQNCIQYVSLTDLFNPTHPFLTNQALPPLHIQKLFDSSDEPYEANTVSVAVPGQGSIPRLIDVLLTSRVFLPSGTDRVLYRDPFRGREIFVEFVPTPEVSDYALRLFMSAG